MPTPTPDVGPVLVVRPEPAASATAERLRGAGHEPVVVPVLDIVPIDAPMPAGPHDAIVLTSATAARKAARRGALDRAVDGPVHAIGEATAAAARSAGLPRVTVGADGTPARDGAALGRALAPLLRNRRVLYPCAVDRRPGLERELTAGGVAVDAWPLYRTVAVPRAAEGIARALDGRTPRAVLLHSPSAARALGGAVLGDVPLLCLSAAIAEAVPGGVGGYRRVAERPDEETLLTLLNDVQ